MECQILLHDKIFVSATKWRGMGAQECPSFVKRLQARPIGKRIPSAQSTRIIGPSLYGMFPVSTFRCSLNQTFSGRFSFTLLKILGY